MVQPEPGPSGSADDGNGGAEKSAEELLDYYRGRVEAFEQEMKDVLDMAEKAKAHSKEMYRTQWENKQRSEEIWELQKALSDAHALLFEERQRVLTLQAENDDLRIQEAEDRKRIQHLLGMAHPGGPEPGVTTMPRLRTAGPGEPGPGRGPHGTAAMAQESHIGTMATWQEGAPSAFKAYPGEGISTDALMLHLQSLQAQLSDHKRFAAERIAQLMEDKSVREMDYEAHMNNLRAQLEESLRRQGGLQHSLDSTLGEYLTARAGLRRKEAQAAEEKQRLSEAVEATARELDDTKTRARKELADFKAKADKELDEYAKTYRKQLKEKDAMIRTVETMHRAIRAQYEKRIKHLEDKVAKLQRKLRETETRRALDVEGFGAAVGTLRRQLLTVGRRVAHATLAERIDDDERLELVLERLAASAHGDARAALGAPGDEGSDDESGGGELDLAEMRDALLALDRRVRQREEELAQKEDPYADLLAKEEGERRERGFPTGGVSGRGGIPARVLPRGAWQP
ncbi:unnamed protein product [Pedinophyceae sp. YPF-701]|nr:unnamed protein product [Pedinophyceae sp. YPF-701]